LCSWGGGPFPKLPHFFLGGPLFCPKLVSFFTKTPQERCPLQIRGLPTLFFPLFFPNCLPVVGLVFFLHVRFCELGVAEIGVIQARLHLTVDRIGALPFGSLLAAGFGSWSRAVCFSLSFALMHRQATFGATTSSCRWPSPAFLGVFSFALLLSTVFIFLYSRRLGGSSPPSRSLFCLPPFFPSFSQIVLASLHLFLNFFLLESSAKTWGYAAGSFFPFRLDFPDLSCNGSTFLFFL